MNQAVENFKRSDAQKNLQSVAHAWLLKKSIPEEVQQWIQFHHSPLFLMHLDRWGNAARNWRSPILASFYARTYLEEYYRKKQNWAMSSWSDLKNPLMRLAIRDNRFLKRLAVLAGVLIEKEKIRKIVDRKTILSLKEKLGEEAVQFALAQKTPLDLVPTKCRLTTWSPSQGTAAIVHAGWILIACAAALLPPGEWKIFLNRLPQSVEAKWSQYEFSTEDFQMSWKCLQMLLEEMKGDQ